MEDLLAKIEDITGYKFEDMNEMERKRVMNWSAMIQQKEVTIDSIKESIAALKSVIEIELIDTEEYIYYFFGLFKRVNRQHTFLKARLANILAIEGFLGGQEKAKKALEIYLHSLKTK